jgi:hypothetical protein
VNLVVNGEIKLEGTLQSLLKEFRGVGITVNMMGVYKGQPKT